MRRPRRWRPQPPPSRRRSPPTPPVDPLDAPADAPLTITMHPEVLKALKLGLAIEDTRDLARALRQPEEWARDFREITNARPRR